jgi:prolyl-tRNA editing enzyme YbaK/EbsC (Cys-tRNA(Pro) deacylase)
MTAEGGRRSPRVDQVVEAGRRLGVEVRVTSFDGDTAARTAADAAASIGVEVDQIVKSLVFVVGGAPVLVLTAGGRRVDLAKVAVLAGGGAVRKASADEVRAATGYAIGGTPPFGHATALPVLLDGRLTDFGEVWAAAGTPRDVFPIDPATLVEVTGARIADVTEVSG